MPVSFLIRELASAHSFPWLSPAVAGKNFAFIGLRDVDQAEEELMRQVGPDLTVFRATDVKKLGAKEVILQTLQKINPHNDLSIHVSFDIDAIDPKIAASTGTPVPDGLAPDDAYIFAEHVAATGRLRVMDMVEVNPLIGSERDAKRTAFVASEIIASFLHSPD